MNKEKETKIEKLIEGLAEVVATGFGEMHDKFEQVDKRFEQVDKRLDNIDIKLLNVDGRLDNVESRLDKNDRQHNDIMNILDNHTKLLLDNRAERAATISRCDRLEGEIVKIKRKVKIA